MSTIGDIVNFVQTDMLKRSDLTNVITNHTLEFYQVLCAKIPFDELVTLSPEIPTVANQVDYDLNVLVPALKAIGDVRISFSSTNKRRLRRSAGRVYDALSFSVASKPSTYARRGLTIALSPPPDSSSYTLRFRYWAKPTLNTITPSQTIIQTPAEWDGLIKYEVLFRTLMGIGETSRAMNLVTPSMLPNQASPKKQLMQNIGIIPRMWNELVTTISQKEGVDEDFNINPVVRQYSYRGK